MVVTGGCSRSGPPRRCVWRSVWNDRAFRARLTGWGRRERDDEQKRELHCPRGLSRQKTKKKRRKKKSADAIGYVNSKSYCGWISIPRGSLRSAACGGHRPHIGRPRAVLTAFPGRRHCADWRRRPLHRLCAPTPAPPRPGAWERACRSPSGSSGLGRRCSPRCPRPR